jgi:hypothetical protein
MSSYVFSKQFGVKHSYIDDLESFYYVFCWLVCVYDGPGDISSSRLENIPEALAALDGQDVEAKFNHLSEPFDLPVLPWFGDVFRDMMKQLHDLLQKLVSTRSFEYEYDPDGDYKEYLKYIDDAIGKLGWEERFAAPPRRSKRLARLAATDNSKRNKLGAPQYPIPEVEERPRKRARHFPVPAMVEPPRRLARLVTTNNSKRKLGEHQNTVPEVEEREGKRVKRVDVTSMVEPPRRSRRLAKLVTTNNLNRTLREPRNPVPEVEEPMPKQAKRIHDPSMMEPPRRRSKRLAR